MDLTASIESIDYEGRGIAHRDGKVIFIDGAITGETVRYSPYRKKESYELAQVIEVVTPAAARVTPGCVHAGMHGGACGGCSMQHVDVRTQVASKQRVLEDNLARIGKVKPETVLRPIHGPTWGYRYRARLSVRNVHKKGSVLVGFHERKSSYVADMRSCEVLPRRISDLLLPLRALIASLSIKEKLPQIELAVGTVAGRHVDVLVLRVLDPPSAEDARLLDFFATQHGIQFWLQSKGPDTVVYAYPAADAENPPPLAYEIPEFGIVMPFKPTDFTQVNHQINAALVGRAIRLLEVQPGDRVGDFFCGLGNFTLPLATLAREVVGIEGSKPLVERAHGNAQANGLAAKTSFQVANLFDVTPEQFASWGKFDRLLIDPPREGALELVKALPSPGDPAQPKRIVYVSCSPSTLARDAEVLVHTQGYVLKSAGVVNMFPHTSHVESVAMFERGV